MLIPRSLLNRLKKSLKMSPVVLVTGARQTGKTTLVKDVQDLAHIEGLRLLPNLLHLLAARAGNLLNVHELSRSSGIAATTLQRYLQLLQTLYLIDLVSPWSLNYGKRFVKSPKIYHLRRKTRSFMAGMKGAKTTL